MKVLGLDQSMSNFGWCLLLDHVDLFKVTSLEKGRFRYQTKDKADLDFVAKYSRLEKLLMELIEEKKPDVIGIEAPVPNKTQSAGMYALYIQCMKVLRNNKLDTLIVDNKETKSRVAKYLNLPKKTKVDKPELKLAAKQHSGVDGWTGDEADAYWIASVAMTFWKIQRGLIDKEELNKSDFAYFAEVSLYTRGPNKGTPKRVGLLHRPKDRYFTWSSGE